MRYIYHAATATGLLGHELREIAKEDVPGELAHAMFLADKIAALGGDPDIRPRPPKKHKSAKDMLQEDVAAERTTVQNYTQRIKMADELGDKGLVIRLEDMLAEESDHAEELERLAR
jgi:bacterioferritin